VDAASTPKAAHTHDLVRLFMPRLWAMSSPLSTSMTSVVTFQDGGPPSCYIGLMPARSTRSKPRAYHHGDLRAALIAASTKLVRERGAAAFSLREAARLVGVDPAACYRHFRDRGEVLLVLAQACFADLGQQFRQERERLASRKATTRDVLLALGQVYLTFALGRQAEFRLMFGESGLPTSDPRLRLGSVERGPYQQLLEILAPHLGCDEAAPAVSRFANALWAAAHGVARLVIDGALPLPEEEARALLNAVLSAVVELKGADSIAHRSTRRR
jgi:AcrR family transcriptional regulator